ncbi:MAG: TetR/AcrR family transcriptional regulator [Paracoccaceae bacterium]|nr:TetR/AcrR family transcriptional regulator [Paracoccaceae bacterium]
MARTSGSFSQKTAPRVAQTALKLFAKYGYASVSMRQIARDVGVQVGALYNYTPDKQALLFNILLQHMESLLVAWARYPKRTDPTDQINDFIQFHLEFHFSKVDEVFVAYMELRNLNPQNFVMIEKLRCDYETVLQKILNAGLAAEQFQIKDTKIATLAIIGMLKEVGTWYRPDGRLGKPEIISLYQNMTLDVLGSKHAIRKK